MNSSEIVVGVDRPGVGGAILKAVLMCLVALVVVA